MIASTLLGLLPLAAQAMSFSEALARLNDSHHLEITRAKMDAADAQAQTARALGRPTVKLGADYVHLADPVEFDLGRLRDLIHVIDPGLPSIPNLVLQPQNFGIAGATASWPLYTGGRVTAAERAAAAGQEAASAGHELGRDELFVLLVTRSYGLDVAKQSVSVQRGVNANLAVHLDHARALEANGQIPKAERMLAEVALAEGEQAGRQREHAAVLAQSALANLLGLDAPAEISAPPLQIPATPALADMRADALSLHPGLRQLAALQAEAEQGVAAAQGEYLPTLALVGAYQFAAHNLPELTPRWAVGTTLSMPLFDGGSRQGRLSAARAKVDEVAARRASAEDDLRLLVEQRYLALEDARRRIGVAEQTIGLTTESLRMQRVAFAEGVGRSTDVSSAENALANAQLGRLAAQFDATLAYASLMVVVGRRTEAERRFSAGSAQGTTP